MSFMSEYLAGIASNRKVVGALAAAGVLAALTGSPAVANDTKLLDRKSVSVSSAVFATKVEERVDDQLSHIKSLSEAIASAYELTSPHLASSDKGRTLASKYVAAMQQAPHPELSETDRYFLDGQGEVAALTKAINDKKQTLLEGTYYLQRIQTALIVGKDSDVEEYSERLAALSSRIDSVTEATSPAENEPASTVSVSAPERFKINVELVRERIDVRL